MILFHNVVEIFALADFDTLVYVGIVLFDGGRIGATFININQAGFAAGINSFIQKSSCCSLIPLGSQ